MKTVVKINPEKEYKLAKESIQSLTSVQGIDADVAKLDGSVDNLKTVINVLIERLSPKKRKPKKTKTNRKKPKAPREEFDKLPSIKFPELDVFEEVLKNDDPPSCPFCTEEMKESGLYKVSEKLEIIPKSYYIVRHKRVIYNCGNCNGSLQNAKPKPSIIPNSNYGDNSLIIDAALSKFCDLIPMERYSAMAAREGIEGLPPNSLIGVTHSLASFFDIVYRNLKEEVLASRVLFADETPHNILEGDETSNWYFWGFACNTAVYFETHDTRSGDVPLEFLKLSFALYLLTDAYAGYKKALRILGKEHDKQIVEANCNAHAIRYFKDASQNWSTETEHILHQYQEIYAIERNDKIPKEHARQEMLPLFQDIKIECEKLIPNAVAKSSFEKAAQYFLNHYEGLSRCCTNIEIPLDNNFTERILRSYVVGRKTWSGTHSKRGAQTSAKLFSIVESCKINNINPRNYFQWAVQQIHQKSNPLTPSRYAATIDSG